MMLKDEINQIEDISQVDKFLENTKCGFLLEQLRKMPDIQIYFNKIILKTVEKIENSSSFKQINLNINERFNEFYNLVEEEKKKIPRKKRNMDEIHKNIMNNFLNQNKNNYEEGKNSVNNDNLNKKEIFEKKYSNLYFNELQNLYDNAKFEKKLNLYAYLKEIITNINKNKNQDYSTSNLKQKLEEKNLSSYLYPIYIQDFFELISFLEQLIEDLMNNILLLPNSIKYICKIISILIKKKFNNITKTEENAFISKFIIGKLLIPIISFPSYNAYISDFIISQNTINNINILNIIIKNLFLGKLFSNNKEEAEYTPFNRFIIEKMDDIFKIFEKSINVYLPNFIEKFINDELPQDYSYEFFNENKEEIYATISICYTIDNLKNLIKGLEKCEELILSKNPKIKKLKKSLEKLKKEETFQKIKEVDNKKKEHYIKSFKVNEKNKDKEKEVEILNFYLYNDYTIEKKYENLFSINNEVGNFYINIKKLEKKNKLEEKERNVIKIKNYLCNSIGNFRLLNKLDFSEEAISNTTKMLNEIKNYMSLPNFILNNNTIPSIWYINSILDYLKKIPQDYIDNDYKKLFIELRKNLNDSINELNFEKLILFRNKLKFIDKINNYYDNLKQKINNIEFNRFIKKIVEKNFLPIDLILKFGKKENILDITKSSIKEKTFENKIILKNPKKHLTSFKTIEAFTRYFPSFVDIEKKEGISTIDIIRKLNLKEKLQKYLKIVEEELSWKNQKYESIYKDKLQDYVMNKIYDKIYPSKINLKDNLIYKKSLSLSWVDPHLLFDKDYIFDNMLPDIINEFNQIYINKNPFKKLENLRKIMSLINILIKFNEGIDKEIGAEDITPVLNYVFIKACPWGLKTDLEFVKSFLDNYGQYENSIANIDSMCDVILNTTAESFNLTQEEFNKRCDISESDIKKDIDQPYNSW